MNHCNIVHQKHAIYQYFTSFKNVRYLWFMNLTLSVDGTHILFSLFIDIVF